MTAFLRPLALACLAAMTLVWSAALAQEPRVWLVLAEEGGVYAETAAVLRAELGMASIEAMTDLADPPARVGAPPDLIVTAGAAAFDNVLRRLSAKPPEWARVPVIASLLPYSAYVARIGEAGGLRPISAVILDQPVARQMALVRRVLPGYSRVGVLPGPQTRPLLEVLEREARVRNLQLVTGPPVAAAADVFPALREVLATSDVLLALPEPLVYHGASLQNILLATYRARVPVIAFSAAYVKAGALAAVYATPAQVARETAFVARQWLAGRGMPPARAPREFAVATNPRVAASLGISIDDADRIAEDLRKGEGVR